MADQRQDGRPPYTGVRFDGDNFDSWQFGVKLAIQSEDLWSIVSGAETKPAREPVSVDPKFVRMYNAVDNSSLQNYFFANIAVYVREVYHTGYGERHMGFPHSVCETIEWLPTLCV